MRYEQYYELSDKHAWRASDLDWDALRRDEAAGLVSDFDRLAVVGTAIIEHGVPHYGEVWSLVSGLREHWDLWQFATLWTGEEHRHSFVLKKACDLLGLAEKVAADLARVSTFPFAETQKASCPTDCYRTVAGMLTYTMIQELATNKFYGLAAKKTSSPFLRDMFLRIAGDEMRHHVFYRDALRELHAAAADPDEVSEQSYHAARAFRMPHLVYDVQMDFFEHGSWSIGRVGKLAFQAQLVRCFAFDASLLARLLREDAGSEIQRSGERAVTPRLA